MQNKVFCSNCKFLKKVAFKYQYFYLKYDKNGLYEDCHDSKICVCRTKTKVETHANPIRSSNHTILIIDDPYVLNQNNDCTFYQGKWWVKFFKN